ncbi:MAG: hypothetical protein JWN17_533 [Frankiales bacterium]|nr:hypothetical protein [Frankiales bacterium]
MRALPLFVLTVALLSGTAVPPAGAASSSLADLRADADRTTKALVAGTTRLEADRGRLTAVQRSAVRARRDAAAAERSVAVSRRRLGRVVAAAYRQPAPDDVLLALGGGSGALQDALVARADLDHVRGDEQDLLRVATADSVRARTLARSATELEGEARTRERAVAREVARLQALASSAQKRLQAASDRLARADAARRDAAARADRSSRPVDLGSCSGGSTDGAPNGFLPGSALCPIGGGHRLRADAAAAFLRMDAVRHLCVTDSYRSYAAQVSVYRRKPSLAAVPGTSNHGRGVALDLGCGAERFGSDTYDWLKANAGRFGWHHPSWAEPGGGKPEPWHWEYVG